MSPPTIAIDVVSDVVCPWCYLGKRRLERALAQIAGIEPVVRWRPYRLDATIPPEGIDRTDYIVRKFGSPSALDAANARLVAYGKAEGIDYHFDRITRTPDTTDAHRLIRWAHDAGKEDATVERLFAAYFTEGRDVGDRAVLAELAGEIGLDAEQIRERLLGDDDRGAVTADIEEAYRMGVTGVPCFVIDRRYAVAGAHPSEVIARTIVKAAGARPPGAA